MLIAILLILPGIAMGAPADEPLPPPPGLAEFLAREDLSFVYKGRELVRIEIRSERPEEPKAGEESRTDSPDLDTGGSLGDGQCRSAIQRDSEGTMTGCLVEYSQSRESEHDSTTRYLLDADKVNQSQCILYCSRRPASGD
jgi:hypothetical protein